MKINNPGEAMRAVAAILRHEGYGVDEVTSRSARFDLDKYEVAGHLSDLALGHGLGTFVAEVERSGRVVISAGSFGVIEEDPDEGTIVDPFAGL